MADDAMVLRAAGVPARQVRTGQGFYVGFGSLAIAWLVISLPSTSFLPSTTK